MEAKEVALEMYKREHVRWNQWALFFFGTIAAVFVAWDKLSDIVPFWICALVASFLSCAWSLAALSIRATTDAWRAVLERLEDGRDTELLDKPFHIFREELKRMESRWSDLKKTINFLCRDWWRKYIFSVTRLLVSIGLLLALLFFALAVLSLLGRLT